MTARRVRAIASRKKYDTRLGSPNNFAAPIPLNLNTGSTYILSCASYIPTFDLGHSNQRHQRGAEKVFLRGVKERCLLQTVTPLTWRRVVFWSYDRHSVGLPIRYDPAEGDPVIRRNLRPFKPRNPGIEAGTARILWQGTVDVDYSEQNRAFAALDRENITIVSDRTRTINPNHVWNAPAVGDGKMVRQNFWHPANKTMSYLQEEDGSNKEVLPEPGSGWNSFGVRDSGNMYIMDIFSTGELADGAESVFAGTFHAQSTVYWHEQ